MGETATDNKTSEELSREIDESIDEAMAEVGAKQDDSGDKDEKPVDKEEKSVDIVDEKDIPSEEDLSDDDDAGDEVSDDGDKTGDDTDDDDKDAITDELLDRASKVGMGVAKAKGFQNATMLKSVCEMLEAQNKTDDESGEEKSDPLAGIPDIELDPDIEYDEVVIALAESHKIMKGLIQRQSEELEGLRAAGEKNAVQGFFDSKVLGLDEEFTKALKDDPKKHTALRKQHEVLVAGYEATGVEVSEDAIFDQAVSVVLGDVKTTIKESKLKSRKKQQISRPGGTDTKGAADPLEEIADSLDRKHFDKK